MAFAARLASKRKEAEEGGSADDAEDSTEAAAERGLGKGGMSALLRSEDRPIRDPFADDQDEDGSEDGSEDEDDGDGDLGSREPGGSGESRNSWNRGGWWRGMVDGRSKGRKAEELGNEKFGDGRDSSDDEDAGAGAGVGAGANSSGEEEEFGDFAVPEAGDAAGSGPDERVLVKPLPVHPLGSSGGGATGGGNKGLMGMWPFTKKDKEKAEGESSSPEPSSEVVEDAAAADDAEKAPVAAAGEDDEILSSTQEKGTADDGEAPDATTETLPVVLSEDGEKVQPTVEAKRRTSIEEPDEGEEDEVVV